MDPNVQSTYRFRVILALLIIICVLTGFNLLQTWAQYEAPCAPTPAAVQATALSTYHLQTGPLPCKPGGLASGCTQHSFDIPVLSNSNITRAFRMVDTLPAETRVAAQVNRR